MLMNISNCSIDSNPSKATTGIVNYAQELEYIKGEELKFKMGNIEDAQAIVDHMLQRLIRTEAPIFSQEDMGNSIAPISFLRAPV